MLKGRMERISAILEIFIVYRRVWIAVRAIMKEILLRTAQDFEVVGVGL